MAYYLLHDILYYLLILFYLIIWHIIILIAYHLLTIVLHRNVSTFNFILIVLLYGTLHEHSIHNFFFKYYISLFNGFLIIV